jgi:hypothetical protein
MLRLQYLLRSHCLRYSGRMFEFESNRITIDVDLGGKNNVMLPESARVSLSLVEAWFKAFVLCRGAF